MARLNGNGICPQQHTTAHIRSPRANTLDYLADDVYEILYAG